MASYDSTETPSPASDVYHSAYDSTEDLGSSTSKDQSKLDLPPSAIDSITSSLFSGILLAVWDNIMGPRVRRLWTAIEGMKIEQEMVNYVCNHTLNGELTRIGIEGLVDTKFYCLKDRGYIFTSSMFSGKSKNGQTVWSLSLLMSWDNMERYLALQDFIALQVKSLVMKCRVLQEKDILKLPLMFSEHVYHFVAVVESLQTSGLPETLCIKDTFFGSHELHYGGKSDAKKFLMSAITSHLQTGGSSVVIGSSDFSVNLMITTLALFLTSSEKACCRYASAKEAFKFDRDLFVQGVLRKPGEGFPISSKEVILSTYPCTVIDVDNREVKQTPLFHNHNKTRAEFLKVELLLLLKGEDAPVYPTIGLFTFCEQIATMVQQCVAEICLLPKLCTVRELYLQNFVKVFKQKACALLAYTEAIS